jgi:phytoene synthase
VNAELERSYAWCARVTQRATSSFYYSFFLLPREQRQAMCALYAYLRTTDDLADSQETESVRRTALCQWRRQLDAALRGVPGDPILHAVVDTAERYEIPSKHLYNVIDGVEMDLESQRFETFADLERYCHLVASAVGLACIHIWGFQDARAVVPARHCGVAFQLTNILRDLKEDAAQGRIYIPQEDLRQFGVSPEELASGVSGNGAAGSDRLKRLVAYEVDRTEHYYAEASQLHQYLSRRGRRIFGAMLTTYRQLLDEIKRHPEVVFSNRVSVTTWRKLTIAAGWALPATFHRRLAFPPPRSPAPCGTDNGDWRPSAENGR